MEKKITEADGHMEIKQQSTLPEKVSLDTFFIPLCTLTIQAFSKQFCIDRFDSYSDL